jgi:hypothetical protein
MGTNANSQGTGEISFWRDGTALHVQISDNVTSADRIKHVFNSFFTLNTWVHVLVTWDGSTQTLTVYKDGSSVSPDSTPETDFVTQSDQSRYILISGLRASFADPLNEWEGQIHSVGIWDVELGASEVSDLVSFGDGVGEPALDYTGDWIVFVTGNNAVDARQIAFFDGSTGDVGVAEAWDSAPVATEIFRICGPQSLFDDITPAQCAEGHTDHRSLCIFNNTGGLITDLRVYLVPLDPNNTVLEVACGNAAGTTADIDTISPDTEEPNLVTDTTFSSTRPQSWRRPDDYDSAIDTPAGGFNLNSLFHAWVWLRRIVPPLHKRSDSSAWLLVVEETSGVKSAIPLVFDVDGFNPTFSLVSDRKPRTFGGARVTASVVDNQIGQPVEDESITIAITSGPGTLNTDPQPLDTDVNGEVEGIYISPEDDAQAGNSVTITATLGGDP